MKEVTTESREVRIKKKRRKLERDRKREGEKQRDTDRVRDGDRKREYSQCNVCLSLVTRWRMPCPLPQREKPVLSLGELGAKLVADPLASKKLKDMEEDQ